MLGLYFLAALVISFIQAQPTIPNGNPANNPPIPARLRTSPRVAPISIFTKGINNIPSLFTILPHYGKTRLPATQCILLAIQTMQKISAHNPRERMRQTTFADETQHPGCMIVVYVNKPEETRTTNDDRFLRYEEVGWGIVTAISWLTRIENEFVESVFSLSWKDDESGTNDKPGPPLGWVQIFRDDRAAAAQIANTAVAAETAIQPPTPSPNSPPAKSNGPLKPQYIIERLHHGRSLDPILALNTILNAFIYICQQPYQAPVQRTTQIQLARDPFYVTLGRTVWPFPPQNNIRSMTWEHAGIALYEAAKFMVAEGAYFELAVFVVARGVEVGRGAVSGSPVKLLPAEARSLWGEGGYTPA